MEEVGVDETVSRHSRLRLNRKPSELKSFQLKFLKLPAGIVAVAKCSI